ncbi:MAG: aspartate aminotransferase family protein [Fimbriimonadaceae bacterium]|nr:aspartate aminotransferase family protein [Fimbriimonadaceae bacterium]
MDADALYAEVVDKYAEYVNPGLARLMSFAGFGVEMRGEGCYIFDQEGRKYLDCLGGYGVFSLGHRHPKIIEAVKNQLDIMPLSGKAFFNKNQADLAEKLAQVSPEGLQFTFFSNSGAEAVEAALKFAKGTTGRSKIVSTNGGYHGKTIGALSITGREKYQTKFLPLMPGVSFVNYGDTEAMLSAIDESTAAFIVETIQGEGGIIIAPEGYLTAARKRCTEVGAMLIVDEVQTGLARTGRMFGCDHEGIKPDIMTMAKCLSGGIIPIGATMGTPEVWEAIFGSNPLMHTSTFGGNPLACAAGLAALQLVEDEGLVERSRAMGEKLKAGLAQVQQKHGDMICNVRGVGLMIGVEFAMDEVGELTIAQMLKRNMVAAYTLNNPRVMRFEPPLIISEEQIQFAVETFDAALTETKELLKELVG